MIELLRRHRGGNFEGANILHLAGGAADRRTAAGAIRRRGAAGACYEARARRGSGPGLDDKRLTSWNALAIAALAEAGAVLERPDYLDAARACAEFVLGELRDAEGRLLRTYKDGEARLNAYLEDHAFLLEALLALYEASFEQRWYESAPRARRDDDRPLRRPRARRLLLDLRGPRGADRPPQGDRRPPDPVGQLGRRAGAAAPRGAERRARVRAPGRGGPPPLRQARRRASPTPSPTSCARSTSTSPRPARSRWSATDLGAARRRRPLGATAPTSSSPAGPRAPRRPSCSQARTDVDGKAAAYVCEHFSLPGAGDRSTEPVRSALKASVRNARLVLHLRRRPPCEVGRLRDLVRRDLHRRRPGRTCPASSKTPKTTRRPPTSPATPNRPRRWPPPNRCRRAKSPPR